MWSLSISKYSENQNSNKFIFKGKNGGRGEHAW